MKDPYLYPNSETLINLFDEKDEAKFCAIEADYTGLRIKELLDNPIVGEFDLHTYSKCTDTSFKMYLIGQGAF